MQSDDELLARFAKEQDQCAFSVLVMRHGELVRRICRGMRLDAHSADDVFQATFLVVAEKSHSLIAGSPRRKLALSQFIHGVAYRIALNVMRLDRRRRWHERLR